jgi:tetratricopeptide (TPR) repeat protein
VSAQAHRCRDDLFARSRRAPLSAVERRALDAHIAVCDLCRAAHAFGALYDAIPDDASGGDQLMIARLAERVAGRAAAAGPRRGARMLAMAAGVALLVAAGGAAAWVSVRGFPSRSPEPRTEARPEGARPRMAAHVARPADPTEGEAAAGPPPTDEKPAPGQRQVIRRRDGDERGRAPAAPLARAAATPTPAELFAEANAARRALDLRRATDLYLALDRRFPESAEAPVALVAAGDLMSRLDDPAAALRAFDRYLDRRRDGALAPEALFGRARAFQQLARRQDEVDAWHRLLRAFPGSIYESAGRQRLGELLR